MTTVVRAARWADVDAGQVRAPAVVVIDGQRITAVHTNQEERIACDAVVLTTELPTTYELLGRTPHRIRALRASPSAAPVSTSTRGSTPPC